MDEKKYKFQLTVYLRSGHEISFKCDDWKFTNASDGKYSGYSLSGIEKGVQVGFSLPDIVAIKSINLD